MNDFEMAINGRIEALQDSIASLEAIEGELEGIRLHLDLAMTEGFSWFDTLRELDLPPFLCHFFENHEGLYSCEYGKLSQIESYFSDFLDAIHAARLYYKETMERLKNIDMS